ncbi:hypothetical protein FJT64_020064 [Amphibalanus amphitrite]|uniref:Uncharacterized protein n=1 Tax=Amphibalanus amphitrite TaxID=1232801 RepID=A0A6A4X1M5_AMPAM|nr:hypothetical protein FJT64_020064 [Amphibalanus amphitrite]
MRLWWQKCLLLLREVCSWELGDANQPPSFKTPSLALKLGHSLKKAAEIGIGLATRAEDNDRKIRMEEYISLHEREWGDRVSHAALFTLDIRKMNQAVTELYERSKPELFDQLISKVQLTGRPSLYVRELQELAGKVGVGEELVRHKLLQSLPPAVGAVLAAQRDLSLQQLGKLADELMPLLQTSCLAAPQAQLSSHQRDQRRPPHRRGEQHQTDYSAPRHSIIN